MFRLATLLLLADIGLAQQVSGADGPATTSAPADAPVVAPAPAPAAAPDPSRLAKAKVLVGVMNLGQLVRDQTAAAFDASISLTRDQVATMPQMMQKAFDAGVTEVRTYLQTAIDWDSMVADAADGYARAFTGTELDVLISFYRSPLGQKAVSQNGGLLKAQLAAGMRQIAAQMPKIQEIISTHMSTAEEASQADERAKVGIEPGKPFPAIVGTTLDSKPFTLAAWKGKVVLVDFWATWCGPCVREMPNVIAAYGKYHDQGFEVVGISLDQDQAALTKFITEHKMPWPQLFDGKGWQSDYATRLSITSIPAPFLLAADGTLIAADLRGDDLDDAIEKALKPVAKP